MPNNAVKSSLIDTIAVLIVNYTDEVEQLVIKYGGDVGGGSPVELGASVNSLLFSSPQFRQDLTALIAEKSELTGASFSFNNNYYNKVDKDAVAGADKKLTITADPISAISKAIGDIFGFFKSRQERLQAQEDADATMKQKILDLLAGKKGGGQVLIIGGIAIVVLLIGGLLIFSLVKK